MTSSEPVGTHHHQVRCGGQVQAFAVVAVGAEVLGVPLVGHPGSVMVAKERRVGRDHRTRQTVIPPAAVPGQLPDHQAARRFVEFADAVRRHRYIGVCYGAPGLGKTLSARTYAAADDYEYWFTHRYHRAFAMPASLVDSRTLMYTPELTITARRLNLEVGLHVHRLSHDIERALNPGYDPEFDDEESECHTELVIIDEADRLRTTGLEQLRDFFDRSDLGLILIGMPGFDRQLARYPQLYSRIGFAHQYQPLDPDDIPTVLAQYWDQLGQAFDPSNTDHAETVSAVKQITGGNFRLIERLMTQIARVMAINQLEAITPDVVHARQILVIGAQ
jgi:DNA transposition AAA+ family ATPase